jgi:hypothetical protein
MQPPDARTWNSVSLSGTALTGGQVYHLVVEYLSGAFSGGRHTTLAMGTSPAWHRNNQGLFDANFNAIIEYPPTVWLQ